MSKQLKFNFYASPVIYPHASYLFQFIYSWLYVNTRWQMASLQRCESEMYNYMNGAGSKCK